MALAADQIGLGRPPIRHMWGWALTLQELSNMNPASQEKNVSGAHALHKTALLNALQFVHPAESIDRPLEKGY